MLDIDFIEGRTLVIGPIYYETKDSGEKKGPEYIKVQMYQNSSGFKKVSFDAPRDIYIGRGKPGAERKSNFTNNTNYLRRKKYE